MNMKGLRKYDKFSYLELFWEKKAAEDSCEYVGCGSAVLFHNIVQPSGYKQTKNLKKSSFHSLLSLGKNNVS
jgi:hypothetical protein